MIEYVNYNQIINKNPKNKKYLETTLKARLEFKNEVAPKYTSGIKSRLVERRMSFKRLS